MKSADVNSIKYNVFGVENNHYPKFKVFGHTTI